MDLERIYNEISHKIKNMSDEEIQKINSILNENISDHTVDFNTDYNIDISYEYKIYEDEYHISDSIVEDKNKINILRNENINNAA